MLVVLVSSFDLIQKVTKVDTFPFDFDRCLPFLILPMPAISTSI